ncbi:MAG TPA: ABC transporter ATP-binding protein [Rhizobiales bacterium]|nr:ABC transporter ATP-binding protein [Hyphomicrobiales bacterium]
MDIAVSVSDLNVYFGEGRETFHAVKNVSFAVERGDTFGLVGESGSGKSTVLRAIAGLIEDWDGTIMVGGQSIGKKRSKDFFKNLQMVFQDPYGSLHPRHTLDRMLSEPLNLHGVGDVDKRINKIMDEVGLPRSFRFRYSHQLSGGQRQRVAIARALVLEPSIILLDEPTSALDVSVQAEILNLLKDLQAEHNLTYILVSHNLAVVAHMCSQTAVMNNGEIVEVLNIDKMTTLKADHPYTQQLLSASLGYDADKAAAMERL